MESRIVAGSFVLAFATLVVWHSPGFARAADSPLTISEPEYAYGEHPVGTETSHHFTVTNGGTATAHLDVRSADGISDFDIRNDDCVSMVSLAAGASCGFDVVFTPKTVDDLSGDVMYHYDLGVPGVFLSGTGTPGDGGGGPPKVTVPGDMTVDADRPAGAPVNFTVRAVDGTGNAIAPTCNHDSGWTFPVGTTTVSCSATSGGATATGTFDVTVRSAADQLADLAAAVAALNLTGGLGTVLHNELADAARKIGAPSDACAVLTTFNGQVVGKAGDKLTVDQAEALIGAANRIMQALGCTPPGSAVPGAEASLLELARTIDAMGLSAGEATTLEAKAYAAARSLAAGQTASACSSLDGLAAQVATDKKKLSPVQSVQLTATVALIRASLGCPPPG